jgi:hypothetical protein
MAVKRTRPAPVAGLTGMPVKFIECHTMGHQWSHIGVIAPAEQVEGFKRPFGAVTGMVGYHSGCTNCTTTRVAWITYSGEKINRYRYPESYSRRGENRVTHAEYRRTFAAVLFEDWTPS